MNHVIVDLGMHTKTSLTGRISSRRFSGVRFLGQAPQTTPEGAINVIILHGDHDVSVSVPIHGEL